MHVRGGSQILFGQPYSLRMQDSHNMYAIGSAPNTKPWQAVNFSDVAANLQPMHCRLDRVE